MLPFIVRHGGHRVWAEAVWYDMHRDDTARGHHEKRNNQTISNS